ncbi:hypothetical protein RI129_001225 [Pyrocoelia pectoralis]|uniref:Uncharacterized protein n=1 Tax=Pyrocoelia pectoralis TaxID=417401 RepID=A0AAN7ZX15_9COLE
MKSSFLLIFVRCLMHISLSFEECRVIEGPRGIPNYMCDSIQDLDQKSIFLDVVIYKGDNVSLRNLGPLTPTFTATLVDKASGKFNKDIVNAIEKVSSILNSNTVLTRLTVSTFDNVQLEKIYLRNGHIESIEPRTFAKLKNVREIHIIYNALQRVQSEVFSDLPIETLALSNNKIMYIERNAFINMKNLKNLYLDGNLLTEFTPESLMFNVNQLETLHLQNNSFTTVSRNLVKIFANLRVLNLSHNKIFNVLSYAFEDLLQLESLNLAHNLIYELRADIFPKYGFPILSKLNIAYNRLSDLPVSVLEKLQELEFISIGGNPWHCFCLDLIQIWMNKNNIKQVCDEEYNKGIRPICVFDETGVNTCTFSDKSLYHKYSAVNNRFPKTSNCAII